jgi:iron(III) transport system substrate-binding protein
VWPDQNGVGTHVNISGGGLVKSAPNRAHAQAFLEFLASPEAQAQFAEANNEWPARSGVKTNNPELESLGTFKADPLPVAQYASKVRAAQELVDQVGWR